MAQIDQHIITVSANSEQHQSVEGMNLKISKSTGEFYIQLDGGSEMGPLNDFDMSDEHFKDVVFINKGNSDIEITYFYGDGRVRTSEFSVDIGAEFETVAGDKMLLVSDKQTHDKLDAVVAAVSGSQTPVGSSHASNFTVGATAAMIINPADNVNGIWLRTLSVAAPSSQALMIFADTAAPTAYNDTTKACILSCISTVVSTMTDRFLPVGVGLYAIGSSGTNGFVNATYEVLS